MAASKEVYCKRCGKAQRITWEDVKTEPLPIDIPFVSSSRSFYRCKFCNEKNGLWPEEVPK